MSAAIAVTAAIGAALPSAAATVQYSSDPTALSSSVINADTAINFVNNTMTGLASGTFTNTFTFELGREADLEIVSATNNAPLIGDWKLQIFSGSTLVGTSLSSPTSPFTQQINQFSLDLAVGLYKLVFSGNITGLNTAYIGLLTLNTADAPPTPTPLPGALLLMGSVLLGGAGVAKWRKGGHRIAA